MEKFAISMDPPRFWTGQRLSHMLMLKKVSHRKLKVNQGTMGRRAAGEALFCVGEELGGPLHTTLE